MPIQIGEEPFIPVEQYLNFETGETIPSYTFKYSPYDPEAESLVGSHPEDRA